MARSRKLYAYLVKMSVVDGCFTSDDDLLKYIKVRLGLRSKDSDNIILVDCSKMSVSNVQEVFDEITHDSPVFSDRKSVV